VQLNTRHSLRPLFEGQTFSHSSGAAAARTTTHAVFRNRKKRLGVGDIATFCQSTRGHLRPKLLQTVAKMRRLSRDNGTPSEIAAILSKIAASGITR
jgi:hypothetical protein